ncbi:1-aminocyclopropane-1-carboxylate deaminase/D-cysteine desulfhydrase [Winogradskyella sp. DF17]|uniref:1-aminocyclopropane-1-carboxylate deaminase/D-cysteine desulfhydrase n=1 Tax=Winogradskyella pelagia TaxID=2819984 RepID=A0ABS3T2P5_9FLAO|nr:pyridoxal-phosphate dependent enzyme [Winogradskyella sp. DF17]MBO3117015.1 1-aminocyclopropane-1-carboxylate deaminase/D-cysteine desulfhydrase [Winogradskyella sp. DF17]
MYIIKDEIIKNDKIKLVLRREDLIHPIVSGNKFRKLKYNLVEAKNLGYANLLTFGGAYSNHIASTAYAGKQSGLKTIGIIRGADLHNKIDHNPTLSFAKENGMKLHFVRREAYRRKDQQEFLDKLKSQFGEFYLLPEGGTNTLAVKGCEEILIKEDYDYDFICCAVGTGGTIAGIINSAQTQQKVLGFPALKGDFIRNDIRKFAQQKNWEIITDYHFGGYAKINADLISFINRFKAKYGIPLDPIYTGKMMYGILDLMERGFFPKDAKILAIHTGGLQGIAGMNIVLKEKNLPLLD